MGMMPMSDRHPQQQRLQALDGRWQWACSRCHKGIPCVHIASHT